MLAFLHTAEANVGVFQSLLDEADANVPACHAVDERLLADARGAGGITDPVRARVEEAVRALADMGATVIVCTCTVIGSAAEAAAVPGGVTVMRIDRPMAERAVLLGGRIVVLAALPSTLPSTVALLREAAVAARRKISVAEVVCDAAWQHFERGDRGRYAKEIAAGIERSAHLGDVLVLAQASMAPAVELVSTLATPVLSSPRLGVEAAVRAYRASQARGAVC